MRLTHLKDLCILLFEVGPVEELVRGRRVREVEALLADALIAAATKAQAGHRLTLWKEKKAVIYIYI